MTELMIPPEGDENGVKRKYLIPGDPCPCCGQPIVTDDPMVLDLLTVIAGWRSDYEWPEELDDEH